MLSTRRRVDWHAGVPVEAEDAVRVDGREISDVGAAEAIGRRLRRPLPTTDARSRLGTRHDAVLLDSA
jgi:hypothetical protein